MDLTISPRRANDDELAALDAALGPRLDHTGHAARAQRHQLLAALHAVNDRVGWVSPGAVNEIADRLTIAPADVYGVATFYDLFDTTEQPPRKVHVCVDLACRAAGATVSEGVHPSPCLGMCEVAPASLTITAGDPPRYEPSPEWPVAHAVPQAGDPGLVLLRRVGVVDPTSLDDYRAHDGYRALRRAVEIGPAGVVRELLDSGLVGRGGAAFPAGRKWEAVARQPARPHHLVCNADESEPGTFKDRVLLEGDPFAVIEAMTIAGYATGCETGHVYLRGEYPRAAATLRAALDVARRRGFLGPDVAGFGFAFDIELHRGAGAYICGEETAIFNSIEGFRGEPRNKPPFPVEKGLFGKPTVVNNVETLANVPPILLMGGPAYAALGTDGSKGYKLFCLSGSVVRPGVYEVTFGVTLRQLIELAGGVTPGRSMKALLLGGAAGGYIGPDDLDVPLTFEGTRAAGTTLGSGVIMVLDDTVDLVDQLRRVAEFFRHESCGQCVPCRVGTVRQAEVLDRLAAGGPGSGGDVPGELALLADIAQVMRDASICGLGQTAPNAIASAIERLEVFR